MMGSLSDLLNKEVDSKVGDDVSRSDVVSQMAEAAGIESGTVNEILNGDISCPPLERLEGFAEVLDVALSSLQSAAESDGCEYDGDRARITVTIDSNQYDEFVKQRNEKATAALRLLFR